MLPESLEEKTAADIMQREVACADVDMTVGEVAELLADHGLSGVPVVDQDRKVEGVVTRADIVRVMQEEAESRISRGGEGEDEGVAAAVSGGAGKDREGAGAEDGDGDGGGKGGDDDADEGDDEGDDGWMLDHLTVEDIMMPLAFTLSSAEKLPEIMRFFLRGRIHRAFVVSDGRLMGVVTPSDVLRALLEDAEEGGRGQGPS